MVVIRMCVPFHLMVLGTVKRDIDPWSISAYGTISAGLWLQISGAVNMLLGITGSRVGGWCIPVGIIGFNVVWIIIGGVALRNPLYVDEPYVHAATVLGFVASFLNLILSWIQIVFAMRAHSKELHSV